MPLSAEACFQRGAAPDGSSPLAAKTVGHGSPASTGFHHPLRGYGSTLQNKGRNDKRVLLPTLRSEHPAQMSID
jgi:hypothetical protein